jgi:hypothetical protein
MLPGRFEIELLTRMIISAVEFRRGFFLLLSTYFGPAISC